MSWRPIYLTDLFSEMTDTEVALLKNIQSSPDADKLTGLLQKVVRAARGAIQAGGNSVDLDETLLPDQVISDVIAIARWKWLTSFPVLKAFQTDARKTAADEAQKRLDNMATAGKPKVEPPQNPSATISLTNTPAFGQRTRHFTTTTQDGL